MEAFQYLFNRNYKTHNEYFTELTTKQPGILGSGSNDHSDFTDLRSHQRVKTTTSNKSKQSKNYSKYQVTPIQELTGQLPVYSQDALDRIAEIFCVTYTHFTNESQLRNYKEVSQDKCQKEGIFKRFVRRMRKIIS